MAGEGVYQWRVKYLFSILDYHHYTLYADNTEYGHLVVNPTDRHIEVRGLVHGLPIDRPDFARSSTSFARWLKFHPSLP